MSWIDNVPVIGSWLVSGGLGTALIRSYIRGQSAESSALKTIKAEVSRLAIRVEALEKDVLEKELEVKSVQNELDEQRRLRRAAEDELDREKRARLDLEGRVVQLERKS